VIADVSDGGVMVRGLVGLTAAAIAVGIGVFAPPSQAVADVGASGTWTIQQTPAPSGGGSLEAVSCPQLDGCLAVGHQGASDSPLVDVYDGSAWNAVEAVPPPAGFGDFLAISCPALRRCEAVGRSNRAGHVHPLAESWNGHSWRLEGVTGPPNGGTFSGVSCVIATHCEAVGTTGSGGGGHPFAALWDGSAWTLQTVPPAPHGPSGLGSVSCATPTHCVAVGGAGRNENHPLIEAYDGTAWTIQRSAPFELSSLDSVDCPAVNRCEAVGYAGDAPAAEGWNGRVWTAQQIAMPRTARSGSDQAFLDAVACVRANLCESVGGAGTVAHPDPLAEVWDGTSWQIQQVEDPGVDSFFEGTSCAAAEVCEAVGRAADHQGVEPFAEGLIEHPQKPPR
jgi:hypothetical protein